jgi:hypothetical protein
MDFFDLYDRANKIKRERVEKIDSFMDVLLDLMYGKVGIFDTISIIQNEFQKEVRAFGSDDVKEFLTDFVRKTYPDFFKDKIIDVQLLVPSGGIKIGKEERDYYCYIFPNKKIGRYEFFENEWFKQFLNNRIELKERDIKIRNEISSGLIKIWKEPLFTIKEKVMLISKQSRERMLTYFDKKIEKTQNDIDDMMKSIEEKETEKNEFIKFKTECNLFMDKIGYTTI